jgi:hypothetical protein
MRFRKKQPVESEVPSKLVVEIFPEQIWDSESEHDGIIVCLRKHGWSWVIYREISLQVVDTDKTGYPTREEAQAAGFKRAKQLREEAENTGRPTDNSKSS